MILSFRTDIPGQTVQTQIRLLLEGLRCLPFRLHSVWTHYSVVEPHSSNFRVITTNFLGVGIFRKFTGKTAFPCTNQSCRNFYWVCKNIRIFNGRKVLIENSITRVTVRQQETRSPSDAVQLSQVMEFSICMERQL